MKYIKHFEQIDFLFYSNKNLTSLQELPDGFVRAVEGSFENIIGLCPLAVEALLKEDK